MNKKTKAVLESSVIDIIKGNRPEDAELITGIYKQQEEIKALFKKTKEDNASKEKRVITISQGKLNETLVKHGYETIDFDESIGIETQETTEHQKESK